MKLRRLIKEFNFTASARSTLVFTSPEIRLVPERHRLELNGLAGAGFPLGDDFQVRTRLANPGNAKGWLSFQADGAEPDGTSIGYRLSFDGATDLWWDGAAWVPAAATEWNTEAEIAANIATFPIAPDQAVQAVINLRTTSPTATPHVSRVKILYNSDIYFQEDYLVKSLRRHLYDTVRAVSVYAVQDPSAAIASVDLNGVEQPYDITGASVAYDVTADPKRLVNLADTYAPGTKVLTLTPPAPAGNIVEVHFAYRPKVSLMTSQDFSELSKVPAVAIENINVEQSFKIAKGEHVIDKATLQAWELEEGYQANVGFDLRWITGSERDHQRLGDELKAYFEQNEFLRSVGQDELFRLDLLSVYDQLTSPNQAGLHSGRLRARINNAVFYVQDASDKTGVGRFFTTGGNFNLDTSSP